MWPTFIDFWQFILNPVFLIAAGLVLLAFLPLAISVVSTWQTPAVVKDHTPG